MLHASRLVVVAVAALTAAGLSGCSILESPDAAPLTGVAACALGHMWTIDLDDLAAQVRTQLEESGLTVTAVTATGAQSLDWTSKSQVTLTTDYVLTITTVPATGQVLTVVETHSGTSTGAAFINGEVAIPRTWDSSGVTVDTVADNNGAVLEEVPIDIPKTTFDDSVGLELTCAGSDLSIHPRGEPLTQKWSS